MSHTTHMIDCDGRKWTVIHDGDWSGDTLFRLVVNEKIEEEITLPGRVAQRVARFFLRDEPRGTPERMTKEIARLPRKIVQLIPAGDRLFCMCDDGTAWEWTARDAPKYRWAFLPKPGLPLDLPSGWAHYYPEET